MKTTSGPTRCCSIYACIGLGRTGGEIWDADNDEPHEGWIIAFKTDGLGLYTVFTKDRSPEAKDQLHKAMEYFTGSFEFEAKELFINNAYGYQLELPRIIID